MGAHTLIDNQAGTKDGKNLLGRDPVRQDIKSPWCSGDSGQRMFHWCGLIHVSSHHDASNAVLPCMALCHAECALNHQLVPTFHLHDLHGCCWWTCAQTQGDVYVVL